MHANDIMKVSDNFVGFMSAEPAPISDELKVVGRFPRGLSRSGRYDNSR